MAYNTDYATASELSGIARGAQDVLTAQGNGLVLERWLPTVENPTLDYEFNATGRQYPGSAEFRAFETEAPYGSNLPTLTKTGQLPPISEKMPVREYQRLKLYQNADGIKNKVEQHAALIGTHIATRAELARGEALTTGKLTLNENGLVATVDYGRASAQTSTAATLWSSGGSDPLADITTIQNTLITEVGAAPGTMLISRRILNALQTNGDLIAAALAQGAQLPSRISKDDVLSTLAAFGLPNTLIYDQSYYKGSTLTRVIPDNVVIFMPDPGTVPLYGGVLGTTQIGIPAEATEAKFNISDSEAAGVFCAVFDHDDPSGLDVLGSAILLPVLENANATWAFTVL